MVLCISNYITFSKLKPTGLGLKCDASGDFSVKKHFSLNSDLIYISGITTQSAMAWSLFSLVELYIDKNA